MNMNTELLVILAFIFIVIYIIFNKDIFAPPVIVTLVFLLCSYLAIYSQERLQLNINNKTLLTIVLGVGTLAAVSSTIHFFNRLYYRKPNAYLGSVVKYIKIYNENLLITISSFIFIISIISIIRLAMHLGGGDLSSLIYIYRLNMLSGNERIPSVVSNLITINYGIGFYLIYICIHNWFAIKKINKRMILLILYPCFTALFSGSRGEVFHYFMFAITIYYYYYLIKKHKQHIDVKLFVRVLVLLVLAFFIFYILKFAIGRQDKLGAFEYVTSHLTAPIKLLDLFISEQHNQSSIWGEETFTRIISTIMKWTGNGNLKYRDYASFRYVNGVSLGNVYTAFRSYYADFEMTGVIVISGFIGFFSTLFYEKFKVRNLFQKSIINKFLFMYAYLTYGLAMMFYSNQILEYIINLSFIKILIVWFLFDCIFIREKIKIKV